MYMKNEENFVENLVAPARNGPQRNWRLRNCSAEKSCSPPYKRKCSLK